MEEAPLVDVSDAFSSAPFGIDCRALNRTSARSSDSCSVLHMHSCRSVEGRRRRGIFPRERRRHGATERCPACGRRSWATSSGVLPDVGPDGVGSPPVVVGEARPSPCAAASASPRCPMPHGAMAWSPLRKGKGICRSRLRRCQPPSRKRAHSRPEVGHGPLLAPLQAGYHYDPLAKSRGRRGRDFFCWGGG